MPIVVSAVVGTVVGTFVTRWLNTKMPPPNQPPQQVIVVDPTAAIRIGDFVVIDMVKAGKATARAPFTETARVDALNIAGDEQRKNCVVTFVAPDINKGSEVIPRFAVLHRI